MYSSPRDVLISPLNIRGSPAASTETRSGSPPGSVASAEDVSRSASEADNSPLGRVIDLSRTGRARCPLMQKETSTVISTESQRNTRKCGPEKHAFRRETEVRVSIVQQIIPIPTSNKRAGDCSQNPTRRIESNAGHAGTKKNSYQPLSTWAILEPKRYSQACWLGLLPVRVRKHSYRLV
jgi:hypothetical protein